MLAIICGRTSLGCVPRWWCALPDGTPDGPIAAAGTRKEDGHSPALDPEPPP